VVTTFADETAPGDDLAAALAFMRSVLPPASRPAALLYALRHPAAAVRSSSTLYRLPTIDVHVSDSAAGARIGALAGRRTLGIARPRFAVSVLPVVGLDEYLRGHARAALRNSCSLARRLGVTCSMVVDVDAQLRATHAILAGRDELDNWEALRELIALGRDRVFVAEADGAPVAISFVTVDREVANLSWCLSVRNDQRGSSARYLLHAYVMEVLSEQGVSLLFADAVVVISDGLRYFQDRLGFGVANLRLRRDEARELPLPANAEAVGA
jgi:hypothetical protein